MPIVHGKDKIRRIIKERLEIKQQELMNTVSGKEGKFLFVTLEAMNYLFGDTLIGKQIGEWTSYKLDVYGTIVCLKGILDTLLSEGFVFIEAVSTTEFIEILRSLMEHFSIAKYSHLLRVQEKDGLKRVRVEENKIEDLRDKVFYEAMRRWVETAGSDPDWVNFYYTKYPKHRIETGKLIESEFKATYNLELEDLTKIDRYFQNICKNHLKAIREVSFPNTFPFLYIKKKKLLKDFVQFMNESEAKRWMKMLEYRAGGDLTKHPLVPLKLHGKKIYTLTHWIFVPSDSFWDAWVCDLLLESRESSAVGKWSEGYGKIFEKYLDKKLEKSNLRIMNTGKCRIRVTRYPEIPISFASRLGTYFEIDRILIKDKFCLLISCKAHDFLFDRKIQARDFFFPVEEMEKKVGQIINDMNKIYLKADCIATNSRILRDLGIEGKILIPIVLTSRTEPMGVEEVREYYGPFLQFPEVLTLTVQCFLEFLKNLPNSITHGKSRYFST